MFTSRGKKSLHISEHLLHRERSSIREFLISLRNLWIHHCHHFQKSKFFISRNISVLYSGQKKQTTATKKSSLFRQMDIHHFLQIIRNSCPSLKCRKSQWRLLNRSWILFWSNEKVLKLQRHGVCVWHCECTTCHWIAHCKIVHSVLCEFYVS